jgi:hypothetical protein
MAQDPTAMPMAGQKKWRAKNVSNSDWVCQECAVVGLGRGLASVASG